MKIVIPVVSGGAGTGSELKGAFPVEDRRLELLCWTQSSPMGKILQQPAE